MICLPLLAFAAIFTAHTAGGVGWRLAVLRVSVWWGVIVVVVTEVLSILSLVTPGPLAGAWALVCLGAVVLAWRRMRGTRRAWPGPLKTPAALLLAGVAAVLMLTGIVALVAPPNNWDSMTYHMGRVAHWAAQGGVGNYPTNIERQLGLGPWAEYAILQFTVLGGGSDRLANLVQWFAFGVTMIAASQAVAMGGGGARAQALGAVIIATAPMAILQASSTQNDLVCACWVMCGMVFALRGGERTTEVLPMGLALGLGTLTKGTAFLAGGPVVALWLARRFRAQGPRATARAIVVAAVCVAGLNAGFWSRNISLWHTPLNTFGATEASTLGGRGASHLLLGPLRHLSVHLGMPSERANAAMTRWLRAVHRALGQDPEDLRVFGMSRHEDLAGNPLHLVLFLVALPVAWSPAWTRRHGREAGAVALAATAGFLAYGVLLRWNLYLSRVHLPLLALASIPAALVIGCHRRLTVAVAGVLLAASLPWLFDNQSRPLVHRPARGVRSILIVPRADQYFANRPDLLSPFREAVLRVTARGDVACVGLAAGQDSWEYPLWVLARARRPGLTFVHVDVSGQSRTVRSGSVCPDSHAIVALDRPKGWAPPASLIGSGWRRIRLSEAVSVFLR
jgi:hypothetical protein